MPRPGAPEIDGLSPPVPPMAVGSGVRLVLGLLLLGVTAAVVGIWYQRGQTRRCLAFFGADAARMVASAPNVEIWSVRPGGSAGVLEAHDRADVSKAPGLVHLRRGLVEDANYRWPDRATATDERLPAEAWDTALVFSDPAAGRGPVVLVIDLVDGPTPATGAGGREGETGNLAVVGRPGRIGLGRIARGLAVWLRSQTAASGGNDRKTGF